MRRLATLAGAAAMTLTIFGCSGGGGDVAGTIAADLKSAVEKADGVASADLSGKSLGDSGSSVQGTVSLKGSGPTAVEDMRSAYTAMVPVLKANEKRSVLLEVRFTDATGAPVSPTEVGLKERPYSYAVVEAFGG